MALTITETQEGPAYVVVLEGEIDALTVRDFQKAVGPHLARQPANVILDCEALTYINSRGIGLVVQAHRQAMRNRGKLVFFGVGPSLVRSFDMGQITDSLIICGSRAEALEKFA